MQRYISMPKRKDWANMFHSVCLLKAWPDISSGPFPSLFALLKHVIGCNNTLS